MIVVTFSDMVKRSCPFNGDMNPQLKIYANEKVVALGVMRDQHMQNVYEKTKDLLFRGARKLTRDQFLGTSLNSSVLDEAITKHSSGTASMKQMQLTCEGQLSSSKSVQEFSFHKIACCSKCSARRSSEMNSCSFCDMPLCSTCTQLCVKCQDNFCATCSFNFYDVSDGSICRNCC